MDNKEFKRIVVKVGTSTLTHDTGKTNIRQMKKLVAVLSDIVNSGIEVALVSSGSIGVGAGKIGMEKRPNDTTSKQALSTIGQCELMLCTTKCLASTDIQWDRFLSQREMWNRRRLERIL